MAFQNNDSPRPPLPDWIQAVYEQIAAAIDANTTNGLARADAVSMLATEDSLDLPHDDATYALETLLSRGWLYEVDGELRITDSDREISQP